MSAPRGFAIIVLFAAALAGCSGGSSGVPQCSLDDPAVLSGAAPSQPAVWIKYRHDLQNTGRIDGVDLATLNQMQCRWVFPALGDAQCPAGSFTDPKGLFAASPVLNGAQNRVYIGSNDGNMYAIHVSTDASVDGTQDTTFSFATSGQAPITSTALIGFRDGGDAVFFGGGDGFVYGLTYSGAAQHSNWPPSIGGLLSASPTIAADGTVIAASLNGLYGGTCPNGVSRYTLTTIGVQSSPALGPDGTIYIGANDTSLRAVQHPSGIVKWAFNASAPILNAPLVEVASNGDWSIYVADSKGGVFKVATNGQAVAGFDFSANAVQPGDVFTSSPALAGDHLYLGSQDGHLYAVDTSSGAIDWTFPPTEALGPITSSPAVATAGDQRVIVFGSDDGNVYFVSDEDTSAAQLGDPFHIGRPVRSSPAIGTDGTVYVGADDGRVYAIR